MSPAKKITSVGITVRKDASTTELLGKVLHCLSGGGNKKIYLFESARSQLPADFPLAVEDIEDMAPQEHLDLLIVLGGDGTILSAVRKLQSFDTYVLGINAGTLGFLSEIAPSSFEDSCLNIWDGHYSLDERMLLSVTIQKKDGSKISHQALNEAVVSQSAVARLVEIPTKIDGTEITTFCADGLIVATPTGSTAYNLSAGGPIVHPGLKAIILTPIAPFSFSQKPLVIPSDKTVTLEISPCSREGIILTLDGQVNEELAEGDRLTITAFPETAKFLRLPGEAYFTTLRNKLKWGERL